jgi:tetratricopeptide (TPR) repeat protein
VPFDRNPNFTGRGTQLAQLEGKLFVGEQTTKVAITGLGGIGKTQLVLALVYRIREKYRNCSVIWIPATNMESLHQAYLDVARRLSIAGCEEEKADVKRLVQGYLSKESAGQWLLVFDNADDINMWIAEAGSGPGSGRLIEYLPRSNQGCIVFTSRDRKTAVKLAHQNIVEVPEMDEVVATQLLQKCLVNPGLATSGSDTKDLLEELTYLPLAIIQAAAYINENGITFADYLLLLADQEEDVIDLLSEEFEDDGRYHNIKNPVATTWLVSFEQIRNRDPLAADYLSFMCCIDSKDIPQSLLPSGPSRKKEIEAIGTLNAYSFITKRPADAALDLHRLVHLSTRNWLRKEKLLTSSTERVIRRLEEVFPDNDHKNRSVWRMYLPHARYILESNLVDKDWQSRMDLLWRYGMCLLEDGRWNEAEAAIAEVLEIDKRDLGTDHPDTLVSMAKLASTYRKRGRWNEAEELQLQVLEMRKKKLGADHLGTLNSMAKLASTCRNQGRWNEAEVLQLQVLEARKTKLGVDHQDTLTSMANLASIYQDQGQWDKAKELKVQVLEARKAKLGVDHPDTLASLNNLASTYWGQGQWDKAEELEVQVLETSKMKLGADHPDTLTSMANLASIYQDQGQWDKAKELKVQVLKARKTKLGADHPDTLTSIANLASTYWHQGRLDEAEELEVQVLKARKTKLGADHPDTLTSMANLASTYWNQGRLDEAKELEVQVLEARKTKLGAHHPDTLTSMANLASTYWKQGQWDKAKELEVKVLEARKTKLGADHPDTLTSMANLASTYWNQGRLDEAEELEVQVLEARKTKLGADHPNTLTSINNLAFTWKGFGRDIEALKLMEDCVKARTRILGTNHPDTLSSRKALLKWQTEKSEIGASADTE